MSMATILSCSLLVMALTAELTQAVNVCDSGPCQNGGTCKYDDVGYWCNCAAGWTGDDCESETNVNKCESDPCQNGGTCNDVDDGYLCDCAAGWTGDNCECETRIVYTCSVKKYGELTKFNDDLSRLKAPCNYTMADYVCGTYGVKLSVESDEDKNGFSPTRAYIIVNSTTASGDYVDWVGEINKTRLANGQAWLQLSGKLCMQTNSYDDETREVTLGDKDFTFKIVFSFGDSEDTGVTAQCTALSSDFKPVEFPTSLCGVTEKMDYYELSDRKEELFPDASLQGSSSETILYYILNDNSTKHSTECASVATKFRQCDYQKEVVAYCGPVLGWPNLVNCLEDAPYDSFKDCMDAVCDNRGSLTSVCDAFSSQTCAENWLAKEGCP